MPIKGLKVKKFHSMADDETSLLDNIQWMNKMKHLVIVYYFKYCVSRVDFRKIPQIYQKGTY